MLKRFIIYLVLVSGLLIPLKISASNRALVIGLGEQEDTSWRKIHGDNDIPVVVTMLKENGFADIRVLKNQQATKEAIVKEFYRLASDCRKGDRVYIHYSGHGQLMTDINGDEISNGKTMGLWDQSWIPYDAYMAYGDNDHGERHLCDDEVDVLLRNIREAIGKQGQLIVVVDCCHSGDATCGEDEGIRGVSDRFVIPKDLDSPQQKRQPKQWLTVSACQSYQLCTEVKVKDVSYGKLTYTLIKLGFSTLLSSANLEKRLGIYINRLPGRRQDPSVTGHL